MLNFIDDKPATFKEEVKLSWPGDKPEEKMPKCNFKFEKSMIGEETGEARSMVLTDAIEAIECTWVRELEGAENFLQASLTATTRYPRSGEIHLSSANISRKCAAARRKIGPKGNRLIKLSA